MESKKKWYQSTVGIIILLILFFPVGLYLMWRYASWNKTAKWIVSGVMAFFILVSALGGGKNSSTTSTSFQNDKPTVSQQPDITQTVTTPEQEQSQPTESSLKATNTPVPVQPKQPAAASSEIVSQENAVRKAKSYLAYAAFSHDGLVAQLEYEKFSHEDAVYGADNSGGNWDEQAAKKAKSYMDMSGFSRDGLIEQLKYEKFTQEQAEYGANSVGL